jgi:thioredoxin 2
MLLVCPNCGTKNRVLDDRLSEGPKCGSCGTPLLSPEPVPLTDDRLPKFLAGTELPVVVDFWAEWCGPCKMMAPQFAAAARQRSYVRFVKVDSDAAPRASAQYQIRSIPTMVLFKKGNEVARVSGAMSAPQLLGWIDQQLKQ